jgi:hypothetical protein
MQPPAALRKEQDARGDLSVRGLGFRLICTQLCLDGNQLFVERIHVRFEERHRDRRREGWMIPGSILKLASTAKLESSENHLLLSVE